MACHLFSVKPSPELMLNYCQSSPQEENSGKFESKYKKISLKNAFENIFYKISANLFRPKRVSDGRLLALPIAFDAD